MRDAIMSIRPHLITNGIFASAASGILINEHIHEKLYLPVTSHHLNVFSSLLVGATSGMIGITTVYPVDVIKTRLQTISGTNSPSAFKMFQQILTHEGPKAFYKGLFPQLCGTGPDKAISLATRELITQYQTNPHEIQNVAIAAGGAGAIQSIVMNPVEITKVRMQLDSTKSVGQVINSLGLRGLYRGFKACFLRDIAFSVTYFTLYAQNKEILGITKDGKPNKASNSIGLSLIAGVSAGIPAAFITTPLDVLKTRLQSISTTSTSTSLLRTVRTIVKEEGNQALFKGWGPRVARIAPQFGIVLVTYDYLSSFAQQYTN